MSKVPSDWAKIATAVVGAWPGDFGGKRSNVIAHMKSVWFGIVQENCPGMSLKEISELGGVPFNSHTTAWTVLKRWYGLHWRERHGWLLLAEEKQSEDKAWSSSSLNEGMRVVCTDKANGIRREKNDMVISTMKIRGHQHVG